MAPERSEWGQNGLNGKAGEEYWPREHEGQRTPKWEIEGYTILSLLVYVTSTVKPAVIKNASTLKGYQHLNYIGVSDG